MEFPKMLYKGVKPNVFGQLEAEHHTTVQDADQEAQAREAGWYGFSEQPNKPAPKQAPAAPQEQSQALAASGATAVEQPAANKPAAQPKKVSAPKAPKAEPAANKPAEA